MYVFELRYNKMYILMYVQYIIFIYACIYVYFTSPYKSL